jgi:hypothetical protein
MSSLIEMREIGERFLASAALTYWLPDPCQDMVYAGIWTEEQAEKARKLLAAMPEPIPVRFITDEALNGSSS